ncbi:MAG: hypothetical protein HOG05_03425 [Bacteroidetes bacterium]|jgi:hypothetical protein|nr:hypothetical protein [Bacteroidota bacterium]MBT5531240.1 hypothetical protein [Cytophagia bacterium]MBT3800177.1 hypothetical protein [Bacteroidota bacterium]MBT3933635.1 hypothetical protein [Bacteroidota bacterium]MBT5992385.1 hypothetical protein [Bacteroidota bacterium]
MKSKSISLLVFVAMVIISLNSFGQKFVKYIFLENKVKVLIQQEFIEKQTVDSNDHLEFAKLEKSWSTKNNAASMKAYVFDFQSTSDVLTVTNTLSREFEDLHDLLAVKERKILINRNKKVGVQEFSNKKTYTCVFCTKLSENEFILFRFDCPEKQKNKYNDGLQESIKTLFIQ